MESSQWTCSGAWTFRSNHTINPGTSTVTLTGNSATLTTAEKSFHNLVINKNAGQTCTIDGGFTYTGYIHVARGLISHTSGTIAWDNVVFPSYVGTLFTAAGGSGTMRRCTFCASRTGFSIDNAGSTYDITNCAFGTGTTGINKTNGTLTTDYNVIGATTPISGQALGAHDIAADPDLGNLPTGCVIDTALCPFADGYAVRNLAACDMRGSDSYDALGKDEAIYTATGYRYAGDDNVTPGAMYGLSAFALTDGRGNFFGQIHGQLHGQEN